MFGYVKTHTPQLRVCEYEAYRAAYCGLCRSMGKCTGQCSRMTLSYDFAFLVLVRLALTGQKATYEKKRCFVHPLRRRTVMCRNEQLDACAYMASILSYHKISDNVTDERGIKRLAARLVRPFVGRGRALRRGGCEALDVLMRERLEALRVLERERVESVDQPAEIFGQLLADTLAEGLNGMEARVAREIGRHVGRWIYIVDALDDYDEDVKRGRYNPFALIYPEAEQMTCAAEGIAVALKNELAEAENAFDLLDFEDDLQKNILQNIIYLGMPTTVEELLKKRRGCEVDCKTKEKRKDIEADERSV